MIIHIKFERNWINGMRAKDIELSNFLYIFLCNSFKEYLNHIKIPLPWINIFQIWYINKAHQSGPLLPENLVIDTFKHLSETCMIIFSYVYLQFVVAPILYLSVLNKISDSEHCSMLDRMI